MYIAVGAMYIAPGGAMCRALGGYVHSPMYIPMYMAMYIAMYIAMYMVSLDFHLKITHFTFVK